MRGRQRQATGAGHRPSEVVYDRADSAFANARADSYDWPALLQTIDQTGARRVLATHGNTEAIVRHLREQGWPQGIDTLVVMLDGECSFTSLDPVGVSIWWGAYVGMEGEILDHGPLSEAGPRITRARAEARARRGWIMDIYLLRKQR